MEYSINEVAKMSGVSTRTLRYYDEIGLLPPLKVRSNGYRIYGKNELNTLQQILFYREFELPLEEIRKLLMDKSFTREEALMSHYQRLLQKRHQIDLMLENLKQSIEEEKGRILMKDKDKFQGFKEKAIKENEEKYGKEIREKYGDETVEKSNAKYMGQTKEQFERAETLSKEIFQKLTELPGKASPDSEDGVALGALHKEWLMIYWPAYDKEAHRGLGDMYVEDERFKAYYDKAQSGAAEFLRDCIYTFTKQD